MSDSLHDRPIHPLKSAEDALVRDHAKLFDGTAHGIYLKNRILEAHRLGWLACEQRVKEALDGR